MRINKLNQVNFGMPKVSENAKLLVSSNEKGDETIKAIEQEHPDAVLDVYRGYSNPGQKNNILLKTARVLDRITGKNPDYYITINEYKPTNDKPIAINSINGKVSVGKTEAGKGFIYVQTSTKKYGEKLTPADLLQATHNFTKQYDDAEDFAKRETLKK